MESKRPDTPLRFEHIIIDPDGPVNPHIKAVGDINGDGFVDVVIPSSEGGPLVWYEYPGWRQHVIAPSGRWSCDAKLVDMDRDGDRDVLISEYYEHRRLEWYENPLPDGDPASDPWKRHIVGGPRAHDVQVGDSDADGRLEIATRTQGEDGDHIVIWKREGVKWRQRVIDCPAGEGLALGDVDGDGRLDIVIGGRWYRAPQEIMEDPWEGCVFADWFAEAVVQLADMNGNGRPDVVLVRSEGAGRVAWFESPEDPRSSTWLEHVVDDSVDDAHSLVVCDMDNDGQLDIVTAEMAHGSSRHRVLVYLNQGDAAPWRRQVVATTGSHKLCVADVGNTGRLDLIGANCIGDHRPVEMWQQIVP